MTADRQLSEDLTQEIFLQAWRKRQALRDPRAEWAWLRVVAVNRVIRANRAQYRRSAWESEQECEIQPDPGGDGRPERLMDLESALAGLPPRARTVLILHEMEGLTHEEIGTLMGVAAGTCKAQLHRARALLRRSLGEGGHVHV